MSGITVVMSVRNLEDTVQAAVQSVLDSPAVTEMLVLNNWSTDDTLSRLQEMDDPRLTVLSNVEGVEYPHTISYLFRRATQPYVALCDGDDFYTPERLERQRDFLDGNPDYIAISGAFQSISADGKPVSMLAHTGEPRDITDTLRSGETVSHICSLLIRKEALEATGYFRDWFKIAFDIDLQFLLADVGRIWHDPTILAYRYRLHDASHTHTTPIARRQFFDRMAAEFARQRRDTGADDLMRGTPPDPPEETAVSEEVLSADKHVAGQLHGQAWRSFGEGRRREALGMMLRAVRLRPYSLELWSRLAIMLAKSAVPRR